MPVASVPAPPARPVTNGSPPPERPVAATEIARVLPGGDVVRVFRLDWISPLEARELITPLLTEAAVVITIGDVAPGLRPGVDGGADGDAGVPLLVVRDRPRNVEAVARVLRRSE
jgi:hypothetical protein